MKTKKVNAGLTTAKQAFFQMLEGDTFVCEEGMQYYYDDNRKGFKCVEFLSTGEVVSNVFCIEDEQVYRWSKIESVTWKDEISEDNPVLCWVSNYDNLDLKLRAERIYLYRNDIFESFNSSWKYATPVLTSQCWGGK